jgi:LEA14-like dessication related protein
MRTTLPLLLSWILAVIIGSGCSQIKEPEFREIRNLRLENLKLSSGNLSAEVLMFNPNHFGLELKGCDLDIYIDNNFFCHTNQTLQVMIPRQSNFIIPLKTEVDTRKLLKNSMSLLLEKEVEISAKGKIRVSKAGISKTVAIDYTGKHSMPKPALF